ncbi:hypothetical protein [Flaviaesturariibacter amylovorans]|uniref:Uncharacterized protein n=1 Tax=Flaviaesturariibacter amylovorans TaxID=1084520 RepID=A0ABP8G3W9_9BACT
MTQYNRGGAPVPKIPVVRHYLPKPGALAADTVVDYKNEKVKYTPTRLMYDLRYPLFNLSLQAEGRLIRNTMNINADYQIFFLPKGSSSPTFDQLTLSLAPYIPVNRFFGAYENQDKGLFITSRFGVTTTTFRDYVYTWGYGVDLLFGKVGVGFATKKVGEGRTTYTAGLVFR